jgi:hypothetical protein
VLVFDDNDLARPLRRVAAFGRGELIDRHAPLPCWLPRGQGRFASTPVCANDDAAHAVSGRFTGVRGQAQTM